MGPNPQRVMVLVRQGRPIAVFTNRQAGDGWLDAHMDQVELVFMMNTNQPSDAQGESPSDYLRHALPSTNGHGHRLSADVGHILVHSSPEMLGMVQQIVNTWRRLDEQNQMQMLRQILQVAAHFSG
jgi:hypothetical protein